MTIDPDQIRAEIDALLAQLPDPAEMTAMTEEQQPSRPLPSWKR